MNEDHVMEDGRYGRLVVTRDISCDDEVGHADQWDFG